jgi:hypothetical protein
LRNGLEQKVASEMGRKNGDFGRERRGQGAMKELQA